MIFLSGADVVLPDRVIAAAARRHRRRSHRRRRAAARGRRSRSRSHVDFRGHYIVPGFIDVHVHGVEGIDTLDGGGAIAAMAERLPRYGVTAFCPTSMACAPDALRRMLAGVRAARTRPPGGARVLPAHLESNFINPEYKGAQPLECLRLPRACRSGRPERHRSPATRSFRDCAARPDVGIVTLAPELEGGST